ncbi:hypothetical protein [Hydrogenimonas sp. SS33]|uniref:hypothetical protein n=1 Tax=Hydrogenimonas leucolamina TaxID=2954236 RepID=UPI00336BE7EA
MEEKPGAKEAWMHELRHLYGAGILLFYYAKWPILIGWPVMRFVLDYKDNWIIDALWLWCLILVVKDFYVLIIKKERYCTAKGCRPEAKEKEEKPSSDI